MPPIGSHATRSATLPAGDQTPADVLRRRAEVWERRPLLRAIYREYFAWIAAECAPGGLTIELGGGSGNSREFIRGVWISDIVGTPFVDFVADAAALPLADRSIDNIFMVDVLHHLPQPLRMFREAARVLRPGGRLILLEPHISPFSRLVFALAHPEPVDLSIDPLPDDERPLFPLVGPFSSNQAIPTLLFCRTRHWRRLAARLPDWRLITLRRESRLVYPLSGGFSGPCLLPRWSWPLARGLDAALRPLSRLLAFRLLVTLELCSLAEPRP